MPIQSCDPAARGQGELHNGYTREYPSPDESGHVLVDALWDWDRVSVWPDCNGPIISLRTRNTSQQTAWAYLPSKKRGNPWVQIDPGTDITITSRGQLSNLGLSNYVDLLGDGIVFQDPAVVTPGAAPKR